MGLLSRPSLRLIAPVATLALYAWVFPLLHPLAGMSAASLSFLPVAAAAYAYGRWGGYLVVMLATAVTGALIQQLGHQQSEGSAVWAAVVPAFTLLATVEIMTRLRDATQNLLGLLRSKDHFIASVSHELRTPLTGVVGFAQTLTESWDELPDAEKVPLLHDIEDQAMEMSAIIDDLLVASRADLDELTVLRQPLDVSANIEAVLAVLPEADGHNVVFSGHDGLMAAGDAARFRQLMRNLMTNALQYGGTDIWISVIQTQAGMVLVSVADSGPGIPADDRERIFERYHRGVDQDKASPSGVGLGLYVSRVLARRMGGDITYRYHGGLSQFHLYLPASDEVYDADRSRRGDEPAPTPAEPDITRRRTSRRS